MKFVDLFCGIGTIRMGMEQAGHTCVYSVEWDKHKRKIYSIIFGGEPEGADIRTVRPGDIPRSDIWTFGAPCQDFSIAGKRLGMEGERSSLVLEVFRLVRETPEEDRPKYLLYENVKGMLSSNGGRDFLGILSEMESLGYDIEWQLLNSKDFGVPQNRERVFTLGHLRGRSTRKVFPIRKTNANIGVPIKRIAHSKYFRRVLQTYQENSSAEALDTMQGSNRQPCVLLKGPEDCSNTIRTGGRGSLTAKHNWDVINDGIRIRKLTPKECWRLQGISDEITDKVIQVGISNSQMYRGAGDACTVNVIYEIAKKLA